MSNVTLTDWISFKHSILEQGLLAKSSTWSSMTKNWKSLLHGDLVPEDDLVDAIRHNSFSIAPPKKAHALHQCWPSTVPEINAPPPPSPPPP